MWLYGMCLVNCALGKGLSIVQVHSCMCEMEMYEVCLWCVG